MTLCLHAVATVRSRTYKSVGVPSVRDHQDRAGKEPKQIYDTHKAHQIICLSSSFLEHLTISIRKNTYDRFRKKKYYWEGEEMGLRGLKSSLDIPFVRQIKRLTKNSDHN